MKKHSKTTPTKNRKEKEAKDTKKRKSKHHDLHGQGEAYEQTGEETHALTEEDRMEHEKEQSSKRR